MPFISGTSDIVWICLVAYSMVQGYLLFLIFPTYKHGHKQTRWLLAMLSLFCAILLTHELIEDTIGYSTLPHLIFVDAPFWYLLAPTTFFYIRMYCQNQPVNWKDVWHIIPALWMIWNTANFYQLPASYKLHYLEMLNQGSIHPIHNTNFMIFFAQSIGYLGMSLFIIRSAKKETEKKQSQIWLIQLIFGLGFITVIGFLSLFSLNWALEIVDLSWALYTLWLSLFLLLLFFKIVKSPKELFQKRKISISSHDMSEASFDGVLKFMNESEPYRNPHYDIQSMARELGYSKNYLNRLIKAQTNLSFRDFINRYRVREAKEKLQSHQSRQFTIESIANDAGFASIATFYRVFKKVEGTTPKEFMQP